MDLHIVPGVNAKDVAEAHSRDVYLEKDHQCKCLTYWIDELRGHVFCLIDAPDKESVYELHNRSHGLVPHKIIEVQAGFVEAFLGRITDPDSGRYTESGLLMLDDSSYRIILSVRARDPLLLQHAWGVTRTAQHVQHRNCIIRDAIRKCNGREVTHDGFEIVASFVAAESALDCAFSVREQLGAQPDEAVSIRLHAGEPVSQSDQLFGDTLQLLRELHLLQPAASVMITAGVRELISKDMYDKGPAGLMALSQPEEQFLRSLFVLLDTHHADSERGIDDYARELALSSSQFYRKITALTGYSPNDFIRAYRLDRSREWLRKTSHSVSRVALETGFTSPSYFTKCFKSQYGLLPLAYQQLV